MTNLKKIFLASALFWLCASNGMAQTTAFTYQGSLKDGAGPANGSYDFEFQLYTACGAAGIGLIPGINVNNVAVSNGIFSVNLDFGGLFNLSGTGAERCLDIRVKPSGAGGGFTALFPRQPINSTPYAIKSLSAENATQLGGLGANQYVLTDDARLSDARDPRPNSGNYIQNTANQQSPGNFNISGVGVAFRFNADRFNATTQYMIGGERVFSVGGSNNVFAGGGTGEANTTGANNSFFGKSAGFANTGGLNNSFFGKSAGNFNTTGNDNAFFGTFAGFLNTTGNDNSFFGRDAGQANTTGERNSFFGRSAGSANTTGLNNSFFGREAGAANTEGFSNAFFSHRAGSSNTTGVNNSFFGTSAGTSNITGSNNTLIGFSANVGSSALSFATAIGANAVVNASNTVVLGRNLDTVQIPGILNVAGTFAANIVNAATQYNIGGERVLRVDDLGNVFTGIDAGQANTTGSSNSFFGEAAGASNTTGNSNSFFGEEAGFANTTGRANSFFGGETGSDNTTGTGNSFFGDNAGDSNTTGDDNSFFGRRAGSANTISLNNSYFGKDAGLNATGDSNAFFGAEAGSLNTTACCNTFVGRAAGSTNTSGIYNTVVGAFANVGSGTLTNVTVIGANTTATVSNSVVLGDNAHVGIGMSTFPNIGGRLLSVASSGLDNGGITVGGTGNNEVLYLYANTTSNYGGIQVKRPTVSLDNLVLQEQGGNVGIGTNSPLDKLHVEGIIRVATLAGGGTAPLCRNGLNQISVCSSSLRYKSNINSFNSGLGLIKRLRPVSFSWKDAGTPDVGFVAEEVAAAEPLLTTTNSKGEIEGVKYDRVGVVLVNAVKEQQTQIEALAAQIAAQKKIIDRQQTELENQAKEFTALKKLIFAKLRGRDLPAEKSVRRKK